jgi:hypothetical protein
MNGSEISGTSVRRDSSVALPPVLWMRDIYFRKVNIQPHDLLSISVALLAGRAEQKVHRVSLSFTFDFNLIGN